MKVTLNALVICALFTLVQIAEAAPSLEELQVKFEKRILREVAQNNDMSGEIMTRAIIRIAKDIFGKHPEVIRANVKGALLKVPTFAPGATDGYDVKKEVKNIQKSLSADELGEDMFLVLGLRPERVALMVKERILARNYSPKQMWRRSILEKFLPDKVYRVPGTKKTILAVRSLNEIFLVEVRVNEFGAIVPVSVRWMVANDTVQ